MWYCIAIIIVTSVNINVLADAESQPHLVWDMPGSVTHNEGLTGTCTAENSVIPPHVMVDKDYKSNCQIVSRKRLPGSSGGRTTFNLRNIIGTCVIRCYLHKTLVLKTISPVNEQGAKIISKPVNTTVYSGMPVTVSCTVKSSDLRYHQLLWMRRDVFVDINDNHSLWYRLHDNDTKTYHLTVHSVVDSAPYTCLLMSTDGKTTSSMTQYVFADVKDLMVSDLLKYLGQFFKWYKSD